MFPVPFVPAMSPGEAEHGPFQGEIRLVTTCPLGMKVQCHFNIFNNCSYLGYPDYSAAEELIPDKPAEKISHN